MNKMISFAKKNKLYLLSFFLITLIFVIVCIMKEMTPFGINSFLYGDSYIQMNPMLSHFFDSVKKHALIYDWNAGFGGPLYRMFFYYLSSPITLVSGLFKFKRTATAYTFIIYLKFLLTGFTTTYYLKKHFKTNNLIIVVPTLLYTFCGYAVSYSVYTNWTDFMFILPILTLSIERLIEKHKTYLFIFTLFFAIFDNYYIAYMICYYVLIYFVLYNLFFTNGKSIKDKLNKMSTNFMIILGATIISLLLSSFILVPNYYATKTFSAGGFGIPTFRIYDFSYFDFLVGHYIGTIPTFHYDSINNPNIYTGLLSILLLIPVIFCKGINSNRKRLYISFLVIIFIIFRIPILDFIINGFHVTNEVPYRYSFLYSFILSVFVADYLINSKNNKMVIVSSVLLLGTFIYLLIKPGNLYDGYVHINIIFMVLYMILLLINNNISKILLVIVVVLELIINVNASILYESNAENELYSIETKNSYANYDHNYRMENIKERIGDSYTYDYRSTEIFSSTMYGNVSRFISHFGGVTNGSTDIKYDFNNPIYNTLFNIKYVIGLDYNSNFFDKNGEIYEYKYPLSLVYGIKDNIYDIKESDPILFENNMVAQFSGVENVYENLQPMKKKIYENDSIIAYNYFINDDNVYIYYNDMTLNYYYIDGIIYTPYNNNEYIFDNYTIKRLRPYNTANYFEHIDEITIVYDKTEYKEDVLFYKLDLNKFNSFYNYLSSYQANIDRIDTHGVKGNIILDNNMKVFASIPYDDGWHAYVDGKEVEVKQIYDAFITFDMDEGYHEFELRYEIPYFKKSLIISVSTFICMMVYYIYRRVKHGKS